jgi:pyruvate,water dikinase
VVKDPRTTDFKPGDILVAERTDPGWIVLYSAAAGLVIERGSLLSHSMIVARELGIPAVVSLPHAADWLRDGEWIELDGGRGLVTRIKAP